MTAVSILEQLDTIAHSQLMLLDGEKIITGSFNFTKAAQKRNAENLLVIHDKALAGRYTANGQVHKRHSEICKGR